MNALRLFGLLMLMLLAACGGQVPAEDSDTPVAPVIPPTTKVSDTSTRNALTTYDPTNGTLRFASMTPALAALQPDDVLVSEPSAAAPDGYLRKVKAIRQEGSGVVLETVQASLPEAISEGSLSASGELTPADLRSSVALVPGVKIEVNPQADIGDGFNFKVSFEKTVLDINDGGVKVKVQVSGSAYFNAGYNFGFSIRGPSLIPPRLPALTRLEAWVGFDQRSNLHIWGDANAKLSKDIKVGEQRFAPKCFSIGPVPVCVVPTLYIFVGASGEVSLSFDYSATQTSYAKIGTKWTNKDGWRKLEPTPRYDATFDQNFVVNAGLKASVYTRAEGALMIYGIGGPTVGLKAGLALDGAVPRNPIWILSGYLEGYTSFIVDLPIFGRLSDNQEIVLTFSKELGRSPNKPPTLTLTGRSPDVPLGQEVNLGSGCDALGSYFYVARDLEDGCSVTLTLSSDRDGPLPPSGRVFLSAGLRTIDVFARDSNGDTAKLRFSINVVNTPPTLYSNLGSERIQATVPTYFSVAALDPNTGPVACGAITLSGFAVQTISSQFGDCRYSVTFSQPGTQTLTATAKDPQGASSAPKSFTVQVDPAPVVPPPVWAVPPGLEIRRQNNQLISNEEEVEVDCAVTITLSARATDPGNQTVTYKWEEILPNGSINLLTPGSDGKVTRAFVTTSEARVRYRVTASNGSSTNSPLSQYVRFVAGPCVK